MFCDDGALEPVVQVKESIIVDIRKTLKWVKDNPGIHPDNIRHELLRLARSLNIH